MKFLMELTCIVFIIFMVVFKRWSKRKNVSKLPPGPWKFPLIGNLHQLVGNSPTIALTSLAKKHGPIMHMQLGSVPTIVVTSPAIAKEMLTTHGIIFANRPQLVALKLLSYNYKDISLCPYGQYWRQLRKICSTNLLSAKAVLSYRSIREEEVLNFIEMISKDVGSPANLTEMLSSMSYAITGRAAFGEKFEEQDKFRDVMLEFIQLGTGFLLSELYPYVKLLQLVTGLKTRTKKLHHKLDLMLGNIINKQRSKMATHNGETNTKCILQVLLKLQQPGEFMLEDDSIKAVLVNLYTGGSETTATTIEWAMSEMVRNPRVLRKAQAEVRHISGGKEKVDEADITELKYLKCVLKETLRLYPVVPLLMPRETWESCEINGYCIPAKTRVIINAWAIARDPNLWEQPHKFHPERFINNSIEYLGNDFEFIPFGAGRRICPGISFAEPIIMLTLAQMLFHFNWKVSNGEEADLDMTEAFGATLKRKNHLILVPISPSTHY